MSPVFFINCVTEMSMTYLPFKLLIVHFLRIQRLLLVDLSLLHEI